MPPLLTVGHGQLDHDGLRDLLLGADVDVVVDVRRFRGSRRNRTSTRAPCSSGYPRRVSTTPGRTASGVVVPFPPRPVLKIPGGPWTRSAPTPLTPEHRSSPRRSSASSTPRPDEPLPSC